MGWSIGYDEKWKRDIGYGVPAYCDHPKCFAEIDRGLSYVCCEEEPHGGDRGCGLFFCEKHRQGPRGTCARCARRRPPFAAKPEHPVWMQHVLTDPSWSRWCTENLEIVGQYRAALEKLPKVPDA